jgi:hypothetical protein
MALFSRFNAAKVLEVGGFVVATPKSKILYFQVLGGFVYAFSHATLAS